MMHLKAATMSDPAQGGSFKADNFEVMMRRHGWRVESVKPPEAGTVLQGVSNPESPLFIMREPSLWYELLASNTFRKLLRAVMNGKGDGDILTKICSSADDLARYGRLLNEAGLI